VEKCAAATFHTDSQIVFRESRRFRKITAVSDEKHHYSRWSVTNSPQEVLLVMKNITTAGGA
jgi:hypothetical protein